MRRCFFAATVLAAALPAHAEWTGKSEAGLVVASGNTETETANARINMKYETEQWKNTVGGAALYASDVDGKTANRWETFGELGWKFTERNFLFGAGRYEEDEFSGFEYQTTISGGVGRRFLDRPNTTMVGTVGAGYKFFETRDSFDNDTGALIEAGRSDSEVVFRSTIDFEHKFSATTSLVDKFIIESGANNTFVQNDISLQVKMTDVLALAVGYGVRSNSNPPPEFKKTDTLTTINLVYDIK